MALQQALVSPRIGFGTSVAVSFTADMTTHEGAASGVNPATGSDLIVAVWSSGSTGVSTNQSDTGVLDYSPGGDWHIYRIANISASVTSLTFTYSSSSSVWAFIFEDDTTLTEQFNEAYGATDEGFATNHNEAVTLTTSDELVIAVCTAGGDRQWSGSGGSSPLAIDTSEQRACIYQDMTSSGDIAWTLDTAGTCNVGVISYSRPAGGGGPWTIPVPQGGTPY